MASFGLASLISCVAAVSLWAGGGCGSEEIPAWAHVLQPEPTFEAELDADAVYARTLDHYAGLATYQDEGTVHTLTTQAGRAPEAASRTLSTAFHRSGRFRFSTTGEPKPTETATNVVWRNGSEIRSWVGARHEESAFHAVASGVDAAGRTLGLVSNFHVLGLLLPEAPSRMHTPALRRVADGREEGVDCYRLQALDDQLGVTKTTFWIDKGSHAVIRIDELASLGSPDGPEITTAKRVTLRPRLGATVPEEALVYAP